MKFPDQTTPKANSILEYFPSLEQRKRLELLKELTTAFEVAGVKYSIVGGYGLDGLYGNLTRDHNDFDIVVDTPDMEKIRGLLLALQFSRNKNKSTGFEVYFHNATKTKLEIGELQIIKELLKLFTTEDPQVLFQRNTDVSLGNIRFNAPNLSVQKMIRNIQQKRFGVSPNHEHDEKVIKILEQKS
ncbi:MAG: nucleotidyltransferase family protein [Minisyncoccia bacterium]